MRLAIAIAYFALLTLIFSGIGAIWAEEPFSIKGHTYHQKVFGFTLELPQGWQVFDDGSVTPNGDYLIILGPDLPDGAILYINLLPVRGLTLLEFINDNCLEFAADKPLDVKKNMIGNVESFAMTFPMNPDPSIEFPELTFVYSRIGDNFIRVSMFNYDKSGRDKAMGVLNTLKAGDELRDVSFLAVKNYNQYGISIRGEEKSNLFLFDGDPTLHTNLENPDGTENTIIDDFAYPARFPAGEQQDSNGFRTQFYDQERYNVDNRGKKVDVYVPDMGINVRNLKLNVDIRFEGGQPMKGNGIIFRGSEKGFYLFDISSEGYYMFHRFSGGFQSLVDKTFSRDISAYEVNRIGIEARDNEITLFLNNKEIKKVKVKDDSYSGFTGLYVSSGSWASFDNYCVEILP